MKYIYISSSFCKFLQKWHSNLYENQEYSKSARMKKGTKKLIPFFHRKPGKHYNAIMLLLCLAIILLSIPITMNSTGIIIRHCTTLVTSSASKEEP